MKGIDFEIGYLILFILAISINSYTMAWHGSTSSQGHQEQMLSQVAFREIFNFSSSHICDNSSATFSMHSDPWSFKKSFSARVFHPKIFCDLDSAHGNIIVTSSRAPIAVGVTALQPAVPKVIRTRPLADLGKLISGP